MGVPCWPASAWFRSMALMLVALMDVTDWKRADALMVSSHHVLELIAGGSELTVVLETLCRRMETHLPGSSCSILLLDADGQHLRHAATPSLPETYALAVDRISIGPSAGSCGAAASLGEQVIVEDIANSPLWADRLDFAKGFRLAGVLVNAIFLRCTQGAGYVRYFLSPYETARL